MHLLPLLTLGLAASTQAIAADDTIVVYGQPAPFAAPRVPDPQLATMRGGLLLANGFDVAIGIDIQTRIDGVLALHTLYASEGPRAGVGVFTDGTASTPLAPATVSVSTPGQSGVPFVEVDRSPGGTRVAALAASEPGTVNLVNGIQATWQTAVGQMEVTVQENGPPVTNAAGTFSLSRNDQGVVVTLQAPMVEIRHLIGEATGTIVANTGDNRVIDTVSSVNVDLRGVEAAMLPSLFAVQSSVLEGVRLGR